MCGAPSAFHFVHFNDLICMLLRPCSHSFMLLRQDRCLRLRQDTMSCYSRHVSCMSQQWTSGASQQQTSVLSRQHTAVKSQLRVISVESHTRTDIRLASALNADVPALSINVQIANTWYPRSQQNLVQTSDQPPQAAAMSYSKCLHVSELHAGRAR